MPLLSTSLYKQLETAALKAWPEEACGLFVGDERGEIRDVIFAKNVTKNDPKTSFEIDPAFYFETVREIRAGGQEVIGVWHSHPEGKAEPSLVDKDQSLEGGWIWGITAVCQSGIVETKLFRADPSNPHDLKAIEEADVNPSLFTYSHTT